MPRRNGNSRRRARKTPQAAASVGATVYRGPLRSIGADDQTMVISLTATPLQVAANAAGDILGKVDTAAVTLAIDWGTISPNWSEYRILGFAVDYIPLVPESSGNGAVGFVADIHSSGLITPVATSSLANVPGRTYANIGKRWRKEWRMSGSDESGFLPTSSTQNYGGVAWAFTFAAASQIFGYYTVLWKVQFRSQA